MRRDAWILLFPLVLPLLFLGYYRLDIREIDLHLPVEEYRKDVLSTPPPVTDPGLRERYWREVASTIEIRGFGENSQVLYHDAYDQLKYKEVNAVQVDDIFEDDIIEFDAEEQATLPGGGTIELEAIGVACFKEAPDGKPETFGEIPYIFYRPDFRKYPLDSQILKNNYRNETAKSYAYMVDFYPQIALDFQAHSNHHLRMVGWRVVPEFGTVRELDVSFLPPRSGYRISSGMDHWAPNEILVEIDMTNGPETELIIHPEPGWEYISDHFYMRVLAVRKEEGELLQEARGDSTTSNAPVTTVNFPDSHEREIHAEIFLAVLPDSIKRAINYSATDKKGKSQYVPRRDYGDAPGVVRLQLRSPLGDLESITASIPSESFRGRIRLKSVPGLPEENTNPEDLFDIKIPYIRIVQPYNQMILIEDMTGLDIEMRGTSRYNPALYPKEFQDATLREIALDFADAWNARKMVVDSEEGRIDMELVPVAYRDGWIETMIQGWLGL